MKSLLRVPLRVHTSSVHEIAGKNKAQNPFDTQMGYIFLNGTTGFVCQMFHKQLTINVL